MMTPATKWEAADKAFNKGVEAYIEFGQECARLNADGTTQQEIGNRYGMSQANVAQCLAVGADPRISNTNNLPRSTYSLYLLTTLDDKGFELLAKPDTTQADIKAYKEAQQPQKPKAIPAPKPEQEQPKDEDMKKNSYSVEVVLNSIYPQHANYSGADKRELKEQLKAINPNILSRENEELLRGEATKLFAMRHPDYFTKQREQLPKSMEERVQRAIRIETGLLHKQFRDAVDAGIKEQLADRIAHITMLQKQAEDAKENYMLRANGIASQLSQDDYKFLLNVLHPDRAPNDRKDKFTKAFNIVRGLDSYMKAYA